MQISLQRAAAFTVTLLFFILFLRRTTMAS